MGISSGRQFNTRVALLKPTNLCAFSAGLWEAGFRLSISVLQGQLSGLQKPTTLSTRLHQPFAPLPCRVPSIEVASCISRVSQHGPVLWCPQLLAFAAKASVFLDRICIHQSDPRLKMEGVMSIGAFLKRSERMLVLWDASYMQRPGSIEGIAPDCQRSNYALFGFGGTSCCRPERQFSWSLAEREAFVIQGIHGLTWGRPQNYFSVACGVPQMWTKSTI